MNMPAKQQLRWLRQGYVALSHFVAPPPRSGPPGDRLQTPANWAINGRKQAFCY